MTLRPRTALYDDEAAMLAAGWTKRTDRGPAPYWTKPGVCVPAFDDPPKPAPVLRVQIVPLDGSPSYEPMPPGPAAPAWTEHPRSVVPGPVSADFVDALRANGMREELCAALDREREAWPRPTEVAGNYRDPPAPRVVTPWPRAPWWRRFWAWLTGRLWDLEFRRRWPVTYDVYVRELGRRPGRAAWEPNWWNPWRSRGRVVQALDELEYELTQKRIGDAMAEREYEIREGCE